MCVCKITEFMSIYWDLPFVLLASERFDLFGFFWEMWVSVPVWLILGPIRCDGHVFAHCFLIL